ncbi:LysR family transcriptional regulator substrate-binding protein, partial [Paenibacillus sepulcri]|nr:LysR family transcriptional regulator substrate-binding protein [Paenibacillus sepulcri]
IKRGSLAVGALPGELSQLVSSLLLDYHRSHPHILVKVVSSDDVAERILRSELDLAITILPVEDERITEIPLYDEELCLVVSSGHPLAARDEADMDEIRDLPFILFPQNYRCREQMDLACRAEGIHITPVIETDSAMSIINLVEEQAGISILSRTLLNLAHNDKIKILKLNAPALHRKIGVIHHRDRYTGFAAREFIELLHRGAEVSSLPDRTIPTSTEL